jgi:hypothetical protein
MIGRHLTGYYRGLLKAPRRTPEQINANQTSNAI